MANGTAEPNRCGSVLLLFVLIEAGSFSPGWSGQGHFRSSRCCRLLLLLLLLL